MRSQRHAGGVFSFVFSLIAAPGRCRIRQDSLTQRQL